MMTWNLGKLIKISIVVMALAAEALSTKCQALGTRHFWTFYGRLRVRSGLYGPD
jgi:hypothetical protein